MDYQAHAEAFLQKTSTKLTFTYKTYGKHFANDDEMRDIYQCAIKRGTRSYAFQFGDSIKNTVLRMIEELVPGKADIDFIMNYEPEKFDKIRNLARSIYHGFGKMDVSFIASIIKDAKEHNGPTAYDILACLQKYDVGTFEDFCSDFGYDTDSIKAKNAYEDIRDEYLNLAKLYSSKELEEMAEIQ